MTDRSTPTRPTSKLRLAAGILLSLLALTTATLVLLGATNPWGLVALQRYFGVPTRGFVLVMALVGGAVLLLTPVRDEASQRGRTTARAVVAVLLAVGLICWGLQPNLLGAETTVLATSADRQRQIALYTYGPDDRELIVWAGEGLAAREAGSLGRPCGETIVRFLQRDEIEVQTSYGTWQFSLDPDSGSPLGRLGPTCSG